MVAVIGWRVVCRQGGLVVIPVSNGHNVRLIFCRLRQVLFGNYFRICVSGMSFPVSSGINFRLVKRQLLLNNQAAHCAT